MVPEPEEMLADLPGFLGIQGLAGFGRKQHHPVASLQRNGHGSMPGRFKADRLVGCLELPVLGLPENFPALQIHGDDFLRRMFGVITLSSPIMHLFKRVLLGSVDDGDDPLGNQH